MGTEEARTTAEKGPAGKGKGEGNKGSRGMTEYEAILHIRPGFRKTARTRKGMACKKEQIKKKKTSWRAWNRTNTQDVHAKLFGISPEGVAAKVRGETR